jgi:hypothetical protein
MAELAQAIRQVNERELDANEAALASCFPPPAKMTPEAQRQVLPFLQWAATQKVRALPARPTSVAAFYQWQDDLGVPRDKIGTVLSAISAMHYAASLGDPVATPIVRTVTAASTIEPPRSWTKDEKELFTGLPVEIQAVITRREHDRERIMRRAQNEAADLRRRMVVAAKTADNTTEKRN